jgi:hypothetical protein
MPACLAFPKYRDGERLKPSICILNGHLDAAGRFTGEGDVDRVGARDDHHVDAGGLDRFKLRDPVGTGHQHLVPLLLADIDDVAAGPVGWVLVLEVNAGGAGADQFRGKGNGLGRSTEPGLHVESLIGSALQVNWPSVPLE